MRRARNGIHKVMAEGTLWRLPLQPFAGALLVAGLGAGLVLGCGSTPTPRPIQPGRDLHSPDPSLRALAVQDLASRGDHGYVPDMIELLDDRDEAVRLVAGGALTSLTGRESSYRAFAPRAERLEEMDAWRTWYEQSRKGKSDAGESSTRPGIGQGAQR